MIKITSVRGTWKCTTCNGKTDLKEIHFSPNGQSGRFIIICKECRKKLIEELEEIENEN